MRRLLFDTTALVPAALLSACLVIAMPTRAADAASVIGPDGHPVDAHTAVRPDPPGALGPTSVHPNAAAGLAMPYAAARIDVTGFHYDALRTGWNPNEKVLNVANVGSGKFGLLTTLNVDGNVYAQPLLVSRFPIGNGVADEAATLHDVLVIATGHNTVYAFDAQNYALLWQRNLGPSQSPSDVGCSDVVPEYGITSTPVIVRESTAHASIYLVAETEPTKNDFHTTLHRLSLADGSDVVTPVDINPQATLTDGTTISFDAKNQWSRAALAWGTKSVYVTITSHCDNNAGNISGWVLRYTPALQQAAAFNTIDDQAAYKLASVWGSGFGPALDSSGRVYTVTGNGDFDGDQGGRNYGQSVLALAPGLARVTTSFTPGAYGALNSEDSDFGSGGVMLLPTLGSAPPLAVAIGKDAVLYLLNQKSLGGYSLNDSGALQALRLAPGGKGVWGGPAYYGSPTGPLVYVQTTNAVLQSFALSATANPTLALAASGTSVGGWGGSMPIVSSNASTPGTGIVWLVKRMQSPQIEAYDASNLGAPLYQAIAGSWSSTRNNAYLTAMEANGRVYVGTYKTVTVFGLTP
ncbi:MAG: hypothetical protein JSR59_09075 [Proteobacteria bacterium]|nr:hypothetical protein [Pseudomonadota bacterium]